MTQEKYAHIRQSIAILTCVHAFSNRCGVIEKAFADITHKLGLEISGAEDDIWRMSWQVNNFFLPPRLQPVRQ